MKMEKKRWQEVGLVVLGVALHAVYMLSIFDIYFKTPIVHGMDPVHPRITAPAKRLVLFIADGLRADKFFELDADGKPRAPFLHDIMHKHGRWGVSHARPPTESRPGHVAVIAGFYEDPSAVTKGWKANPVEFDSVFNRSRHTVAFGSPDIVPIFCGGLNHTHWESYPHEFEDFATDASFLDEWSFYHMRDFLEGSVKNFDHRQMLEPHGSIAFLHLLGCDTNGHAHRPYSDVYLNNVASVDQGVSLIYRLMEENYKDNATAYVFTADHGMSNKGSHGDGDPACTETPLVAWGAGIRGPSRASPEDDVDDGLKFVDEHSHHLETPRGWGLEKLQRLDVNQADIAPLMSTLLGLPSPLNSVGILPTDYLDLSKDDLAEAAFANAKQILNQFLKKSQLKESTSLFFRPYVPLLSYQEMLHRIDTLISYHQCEAALEGIQHLMRHALSGLHYFQTYDWLFLMTVISLGYVGWMVYVGIYVIKNYTSLLRFGHSKIPGAAKVSRQRVRVVGALLMAGSSIILMSEKAPFLYHMYLFLALFFWTEILGDMHAIRAIHNSIRRARKAEVSKVVCAVLLSVVLLELLVLSFFNREVYTGIFAVAGVAVAVVAHFNSPGMTMVPAYVWASCWFLAVFTLMPAHIPDNTALVVASGAVACSLGFAARWINSLTPTAHTWRPLVYGPQSKMDRSFVLFVIQCVLVLLASSMVWITTSYRANKMGLPLVHQLINWCLAVISVLLPLLSPRGVLARLSSVFLGFGPPFLLLSIGYEALFYSALAAVLLSWILVESTIFYFPLLDPRSVVTEDAKDLRLPPDTRLFSQHRSLQLVDLVLINVAFFGTGNVASIASFEISSVYRFITIFNPHVMGALLLLKLFIPFILVTCAFSAVTKLLELPRLGCYFLVLLFSDVMTIHFFFLVRNTGSWMEIGNSISHFGIMSAQIVFVLLLFAITGVYTNEIELFPNQRIFRKVV